MRRLILSDIHANLVALQTVLDAAAGQWDELWCLGDLVGYGPRPNECVSLLREQAQVSLSGNHDWAALGKLDISEFNQEARTAVLWTRAQLAAETRTFLESLPPKDKVDGVTLAHGSPRHPVWEYVIDYETAAENFAHFDTDLCLVGHTHIPMFIGEEAPGELFAEEPEPGHALPLGEGRYMLNPGSVGQPRDDDPRAAYAILDSTARTWQFFRVAYDISETQHQMRAAGLPEALAARLSRGW